MFTRLMALTLLCFVAVARVYAQTDASTYPNFQADLTKLDELANKYRVSLSGPNDVDRVMTLLKDKAGPDYQTYMALAEQYKPLWQSGTPDGEKFKNKLTVVKTLWADFGTKVQQYVDNSVEDAKRRAQQAKMLLDKAKAMNAPGLAAGANQNVETVNKYIALFESIDPNSALAKELRETIGAVSSGVGSYQEEQTAAATAALEQKRAPADVYTGSDKGDIKKMIVDAWKAKYPQDEILGIHFGMANWERNKTWNANETSLYKNDTSTLGVKIAVPDPKNPDIVNLYMAYVNKNNLNGSLNVGVDTKGSQYVIEQVLKKNYP